jgi:predicted nucleic acid-binding protein
MNEAFADTSYHLALLNADDELHGLADEFPVYEYERLITSAWVVTEILDALRHPRLRVTAYKYVRDLQRNPRVLVVPPDSELLEAGIELFGKRRDKGWSLTDCISFVIMEQYGLTDALTTDHHFEQAGFNVLLK